MESFSGDIEESTEDIPGRKKSKLKSLKARLFGKSKAAGREVSSKLSQSASDVTAGKGLGSDEDLACSQGMMGSRALSHDSIFLADLVQSDTEPARVLSQENVHGKIKALQVKLQQQKMHLGPPPLVLPVRRPEEPCSHMEDDSLPHSLSDFSACDVTTQGALSKIQPSSHQLSPILKPASTKSVPLIPSHSYPISVPSNPTPSAVEPPLDFSSPAQFTPSLDTSAARHRMSVKPRKRAGSQKRFTAPDSHLHMLNNIDQPDSLKEEEQQFSFEEEVTVEEEQGGATSQRLTSKSTDLVSITPVESAKSSSLPFVKQDYVLPVSSASMSSQVLGVKPHEDITASEWPQTSFIPSELKAEFEIQVMSQDKTNTQAKADINCKESASDQLPLSFGSVVASRSSVYQQVQGEREDITGIKRPASGSFHFSFTNAKSQDAERPRSSSFVGVVKKDTAVPYMRGKEEHKDLQPRGAPTALGRLRQEGAPHKSSVVQWDRRDCLKKMESVTPSKSLTADAGALEGEEVESSQELVKEVVEAKELQEEEAKTTFGIKLRSTATSVRFRSDAPSNNHSKPMLCEEECDKQNTQEVTDNDNTVSKKMPPSTSEDLKLTDPTPSGFIFPVKLNPVSSSDPHPMRTGVQTTSKEVEAAPAACQDPQPAPQSATSEVSWMSLAMEKTRSLQQLFTSKLPRDFTGGQVVAQPQAQTRPTNQTETLSRPQIQTLKSQQSTTPHLAAHQLLTDNVKAEAAQSRAQLPTVKPSVTPTVQQKMPSAFPGLSGASKEPQMSKQINEPQLQTSTTRPVSQWASQTAVNQVPLRSSAQTDATSQVAQASATQTQTLAQSYLSSGQQQPPWSNRGLQPPNQPKSTTSVQTSTASVAAAPSPLPALGRGDKAVTALEKESPTLLGKRAVGAGSISEKAAFLEKQAEWTTRFGSKGVEVKKLPTETQSSGESTASFKTTPLSKERKLEGRQGVNPAESSPTKVPDRPCEDKWPRKNVGSALTPSSSPTMPSALQSMSESGQPSWMELAKRKSMAWSDKTMD